MINDLIAKFSWSKNLSLICGGIAALFFISNLHALGIGLLPIDDHEIISASPDPLHWWLHSEAFMPWLRWRPSYYSIRSIEAFLWGNSSFAWHFARLVCITIAIYLLTLSATIVMGLTTGSLFGLSLVFAPVLSHLAQLLGPAEFYCLIGLSLWAYGCTKLVTRFESVDRTSLPNNCAGSKHDNFLLYASLLFAGSVIAVGSKENFVILILPNLWILYRAIQLNRYFKIGNNVVLVITMAVAAMLPMLIFIGQLYATAGKDVYGKNLSPEGSEILSYIISSLHAPGIVILCVTLFTLFWSVMANRRLEAKMQILLFLFSISIWSVYVNREPVIFVHFFRYALLHQLGILGMAWIVVSYWTNDLSRFGPRLGRAIVLTLSAIILPIGLFFSYISYGLSIRLATDSQRWNKLIDDSGRAFKKTDLPVAVVAQSDSNCIEHCGSAAQFLKLLGGIPEKQINIIAIDSQEVQKIKNANIQARESPFFSLASKTSFDKKSVLSSDEEKEPAGRNASPFSSASINSMHDILCVLPIEDVALQAILNQKCKKVISYRGQHFHHLPWINRFPYQLTKLVLL